MAKVLSKRLQRLEQECLKRDEHQGAQVEIAEDRLMKGAIARLTDTELEHIGDFSAMQTADPEAQPNPEQQAALDAYEGHIEALNAGRLQTIRTGR